MDVTPARKQRIQSVAARSVYAVYDYAVSPITFDFLQFVECAEMFRRKLGRDRLNFLLTLGADGDFRNRTKKDQSLSFEEKMWRVRQIHIPACWLVESCASVAFYRERAEFERSILGLHQSLFFHPRYDPDDPLVLFSPGNVLDVFHQSGESPLVFRATPASLDLVDRWIQANGLADRRLVALTLRQSRLEPDRNARLDDWMRFARTIEGEGYQPVLIPDTDQVFDRRPDDGPDPFPVFWPGPVNLELRAAFYQRCHICLSDNGAAAWIHQWMPDSNSVTFQPPSKVPLAAREGDLQRQSQGISPGEQYPFFTATQWFAWGEDTYDEILAEFRKLEAAIAARGG